MIRQYTLFCKLVNTKKSARELYEEYPGPSGVQTMLCPVCGSRGNCRVYAAYQRSLVDMEGGRVVYATITVKRVRCSSCGHTHAVLPDYIIPYTTYSLLFILRVLAVYYLGARTVEEMCRHFSITASMLYQWKAVFLEDREIFLGVLETLETTATDFIRRLFNIPSYAAGFGMPFFSITARSFLQVHRDAAFYRHAVF